MNSPRSDDHLLDAADLAQRWNVPTSWIREQTRAGHIPHVKLGRYVRFRADTVDAWLSEQEQGGTAWRKHRPQAGA